jgi:hypothetical protein
MRGTQVSSQMPIDQRLLLIGVPIAARGHTTWVSTEQHRAVLAVTARSP